MSSYEADIQPTLRSEPPLQKKQPSWAIIGGGVTALFLLAGVLIMGQVYSDLEAQQLIEVMTPAMQMLGFATITATGTILAAMMTLLGLIHESKINFRTEFYDSIQRISLLASIGLIISILLISLVSIPFGEADPNRIAEAWFSAVYYALIVTNAVLAGLIVAIVLMVFDAARLMIQIMKTQKKQEQHHSSRIEGEN